MTTQPPVAFTHDRVRHDIARVLQTDPAELADTDNLIDHGLDSIRLMALVQAWQSSGAAVAFEQLAEYPEINHWVRLLRGEVTSR
jgi:bifunctional isochorismate lyase/aryl carrier protein